MQTRKRRIGGLRARALTRRSGEDASVSAIARGERLDGGSEIGLREVGPEHVGEVKLRVGRLPQKEITQSLFPAGANQQVDVTRTPRGMHALEHGSLEGLARWRYFPGHSPGRGEQRPAGGIVDRDAEMEGSAIAGLLFDMRDAVPERIRDAIPASDHAEADTLVRQVRTFGVQILLEQEHQVVDLAPRTAPVVRGERIERERGDA